MYHFWSVKKLKKIKWNYSFYPTSIQESGDILTKNKTLCAKICQNFIVGKKVNKYNNKLDN